MLLLELFIIIFIITLTQTEILITLYTTLPGHGTPHVGHMLKTPSAVAKRKTHKFSLY